MIKQLRAQGFGVDQHRNGHVLVTRNGQPVTTIAGTPSDWRSVKNSIAECRRAGFQQTA